MAQTQSTPADPLGRYQAAVAAGTLEPDAAQQAAVERLQQLHGLLAEAEPPSARPPGLLAKLGLGGRPAPAPRRGLYLHGPVGRGKSMLMGWLFETAPLAAKRRVHFHEFMLEVHRRLAEQRRQTDAGGTAIGKIAASIAAEARLLCFDELQVQNIADAMILGRLLEGLFKAGVVMVATSNTPPGQLYEGGLNRERFLPTIELILKHLEVVRVAGPRDYRMARLRDLPVYHQPLDADTQAKLQQAFALLTDHSTGAPAELAVGTRKLPVPKAAHGVAWFGFAELCEQPLGAADYLALAERFHTLIIEGVPRFAAAMRNEARRFMTLVDVLYDCRINLIVSAAVPPEQLYPEGDGAFEFQRTVSRLHEMQSSAYRETAPQAGAARNFQPFALTSDLS